MCKRYEQYANLGHLKLIFSALKIVITEHFCEEKNYHEKKKFICFLIYCVIFNW